MNSQSTRRNRTKTQRFFLFGITPIFLIANRKVSTLVRSKDVLWADGVVTGPDGSLYFTDSAIPAYVGQFAGAPDTSILEAHRPYYIYRLRH